MNFGGDQWIIWIGTVEFGGGNNLGGGAVRIEFAEFICTCMEAQLFSYCFSELCTITKVVIILCKICSFMEVFMKWQLHGE